MFVQNTNKEYIVVDRRLDNNEKLVPSLAVEIDEGLKPHSIFDNRLSYYHGWIQIPKGIINKFHLQMKEGIFLTDKQTEMIPSLQKDIANNKIERETVQKYISKDGDGVLLPKGINNMSTPYSYFNYLTPVQKAAYRLVAEVESYVYLLNIKAEPNSINKIFDKINKAIYLYYQSLAKVLTGKNGLIRKIMTPRQDYSCHGVACNRIDLPLDKIIIPRKAVKKWCRSLEFRFTYGVPDNYHKMLNSEFDKLFLNKKLIMVGMPDHNFPCIFSMEFDLWSSSGIGFNPAVAMTMQRDFDGDLMYVKAYINNDSMKELEQFNAENHLSAIKASMIKALKKVDRNTDSIAGLINNINKVHKINKFESTSIEHVKELENLSDDQNIRFNQLVKGISHTEINNNAMQSALNFNTVKFGTANAGDLGNILRIIASTNSPEAVLVANDIYHIMAQSALDSKHGTQSIITELHQILRDGIHYNRIDAYIHLMKLGLSKEHSNVLCDTMYDKEGNKLYDSLPDALNENHSGGSAIRGNVKALFQSTSPASYVKTMWDLTPENNDLDLFVIKTNDEEIELEII